MTGSDESSVLERMGTGSAGVWVFFGTWAFNIISIGRMFAMYDRFLAGSCFIIFIPTFTVSFCHLLQFPSYVLLSWLGFLLLLLFSHAIECMI
jgi:hypothetical protein